MQQNTPKIRFVGLYDPVASFFGLGDQTASLREAVGNTVIPASVQNFHLIQAGPFRAGGIVSRAGDNFNRVNYTWENNESVPLLVAGTHSALGGAPTYSTEEFRQGGFLPGVGGRLVGVAGGLQGYSRDADVAGAILADQSMRQNAIAAGVPIQLTEDYGFGGLEDWNRSLERQTLERPDAWEHLGTF